MEDGTANSVADNVAFWVDWCEKNAGEVGVTLLVSGRVVMGTITPVPRYYMWRDEVLRRTS